MIFICKTIIETDFQFEEYKEHNDTHYRNIGKRKQVCFFIDIVDSENEDSAKEKIKNLYSKNYTDKEINKTISVNILDHYTLYNSGITKFVTLESNLVPI